MNSKSGEFSKRCAELESRIDSVSITELDALWEEICDEIDNNIPKYLTNDASKLYSEIKKKYVT